MKKLFLLALLFLFSMIYVSAVECDADLNTTPCNVTQNLSLNSGVNVSENVLIQSDGVVLDLNGGVIHNELNINNVSNVVVSDGVVDSLTFNGHDNVVNDLVIGSDGIEYPALSINEFGSVYNAVFNNVYLSYTPAIGGHASIIVYDGVDNVYFNNLTIVNSSFIDIRGDISSNISFVNSLLKDNTIVESGCNVYLETGWTHNLPSGEGDPFDLGFFSEVNDFFETNGEYGNYMEEATPSTDCTNITIDETVINVGDLTDYSGSKYLCVEDSSTSDVYFLEIFSYEEGVNLEFSWNYNESGYCGVSNTYDAIFNLEGTSVKGLKFENSTIGFSEVSGYENTFDISDGLLEVKDTSFENSMFLTKFGDGSSDSYIINSNFSNEGAGFVVWFDGSFSEELTGLLFENLLIDGRANLYTSGVDSPLTISDWTIRNIDLYHDENTDGTAQSLVFGCGSSGCIKKDILIEDVNIYKTANNQDGKAFQIASGVNTSDAYTENLTINNLNIYQNSDSYGSFQSVYLAGVYNLTVNNLYTNAGFYTWQVGGSGVLNNVYINCTSAYNNNNSRSNQISWGEYHNLTVVDCRDDYNGEGIYTVGKRIGSSYLEYTEPVFYDSSFNNVLFYVYDYSGNANYETHSFDFINSSLENTDLVLSNDDYLGFLTDSVLENVELEFFEFESSLAGWDMVVDLNIDLPLDLVVSADNVLFNGNNNYLYGTFKIQGDNLTLNGLDVNNSLIVNNTGLKFYNNTFSGLISDNVVGTKWCDYSSYTGNTITNYNGVNFYKCPKITEFTNTTSFETINDWSNVTNMFLENNEGKISFSESINMSGTDVSFDEIVKIEHNSIEVETNEYTILDKPATITFKNVEPTVEGRTNFVLNRNGAECPSSICLTQSYDEETQTYTAIVTGFSTYDLEYDEVLMGNAITGMVAMGSDMSGFLSNIAPGIGIFILLLGVFGGVTVLIYAVAGGLKKKIDKKYK